LRLPPTAIDSSPGNDNGNPAETNEQGELDDPGHRAPHAEPKKKHSRRGTEDHGDREIHSPTARGLWRNEVAEMEHEGFRT
jgi:hypothetical protein